MRELAPTTSLAKKFTGTCIKPSITISNNYNISVFETLERHNITLSRQPHVTMGVVKEAPLFAHAQSERAWCRAQAHTNSVFIAETSNHKSDLLLL